MKEEPIKELTISLQRNLLGSIAIEDLEKKDETEQERKEYCAAIFAVFPRLEKDLKRFMHTQLLYSSNEADNWDRVVFGRGTFNGLALLLEHWQLANDEHIASNTNKDEEV